MYEAHIYEAHLYTVPLTRLKFATRRSILKPNCNTWSDYSCKSASCVANYLPPNATMRGCPALATLGLMLVGEAMQSGAELKSVTQR
jgi:hypothetical protein